ncbi:MAG: PaREP1 family protein [Desulfurococcales archaeon]|nr:PaREP1 family protein [Desulfurococcales archaeon]
MALTSVSIPESVLERLSIEVKRLGLVLEEYLVDLALSDLDSQERSRELAKAARHALMAAKERISSEDIREAAKWLWVAASLSIRAFSEWKEGRRLHTHGDLWNYAGRLVVELGEWAHESWTMAEAMHVCYYTSLCPSGNLGEVARRVARLVEEIGRMVGG